MAMSGAYRSEFWCVYLGCHPSQARKEKLTSPASRMPYTDATGLPLS
jgi:hypothetical protein